MLTSSELHRLVKKGDLHGVRKLLIASRPGEEIDVNAYDRSGRTPLMQAVITPNASVELVRTLLEHGASINQEGRQSFEPRSVVALALAGGDPQKVRVLLENGADIHYKRSAGYDALIDAVHGRDVLRDAHLIDLVKLLIASGVELSAFTSYQESALRVLSRIGRFDAVRLLLDAGADAEHLQWTSLIRAVALGSLADVKKVVESGASLEDRDWWERTAWLVAVQTGDVPTARFLLGRGADASARGRCGKPSLFYAIENYHTPMLQWLLETGISIEQMDDFDTTPLMDAVEYCNAEAVNALLKAGADVNEEKNEQTALCFAQTREIAMRLLDAGADPAHLPFEARRALLELGPDPDETLLDVSPSEFLDGRSRRFGARNPEEIVDPFWEGMIRAGISAYQAAELFKGQVDATNSPVWCAERFGQSITFLPDGRIVQIAGEHGDSYDQDFCIYNDVFVHEPDGAIRIFGYPESVFLPTDFHTATLIGAHIYVIGSVGYHGTRQYGTTPIYRLDIGTFRIEQVETRGELPGWIHKHRAIQLSPREIGVIGGTILTRASDKEVQTNNDKCFVLDTKRLVWRIEPRVGNTVAARH